MDSYPKRVSLEGLESEIFKLVSLNATPEQWAEWLRVPLDHAAAGGNSDLLNVLLEAGANGSAGWKGCHNRTLIDAAARGGSVDVMSALLQAGAQSDVNVVSVSSGRSALTTATMLGHEAVAKCLVIAGADVNFKHPVSKRSVLQEAIEGGYEQLVTYLVIGGADLDNRRVQRLGDKGFFPLHVAARRGFGGIVSTLLLRGTDKDTPDDDLSTPLMQASEGGHLAIVQTLLAAGADFNLRDNRGNSSLDSAAVKGHADVLKVILARGADVNAEDNLGYTTLHLAAQNDRVDAVDTLVGAGADIELKGDGLTCLALAAHASSSKAMLLLLKHGAIHTARSDDNNTLLHEACWQKKDGLAAAVDLLLRWGADETATNNDNNTPMDELDFDADDVRQECSEEEIELTRLLLERAPADRVWRRRCWLVMLRSFAEKTKIASSCGIGGESGAGSSTPGGQQGEGCKAARTENGGGVGGRGVLVRSNDVGGRGGGVGDAYLSEVVAFLVGLEVEGVFRTIVGFL
ncbi:unnamed protein product [Pylaiella littoralis]